MAKINVFLFVIFVYVEKGYRFYRIKICVAGYHKNVAFDKAVL